MKIKLKNAEIQEYVNAPASAFPKYTTQLMNVANQNSQATRPRHVGQLSELIQEFPGQTFEEWVIWYQEQYPDAIDEATDRIISMRQILLTNLFLFPVPCIAADTTDNRCHFAVIIHYACRFLGFRRGA